MVADERGRDWRRETGLVPVDMDGSMLSFGLERDLERVRKV